MLKKLRITIVTYFLGKIALFTIQWKYENDQVLQAYVLSSVLLFDTLCMICLMTVYLPRDWP